MYRRINYDFTTPKGELRIRKVRIERPGLPKKMFMLSAHPDDAPCCSMGESIRWCRGTAGHYEFSFGALYRLPEVVAGIKAGAEIVTTEGEKDADALVSLGRVATSHWQGAGNFTPEQARRLRRAERIVIVCDHDEPGALDGWVRYQLLTETGVPEARIRVLKPPKGFKDAAEAVEAGRSWGDFRPVRLDRLEKAADAYEAARGSTRRRGSDWMR